jgi:hypothetical protein
MNKELNHKGIELTSSKIQEVLNLIKTNIPNIPKSRNDAFKDFVSSKLENPIENPSYIVPEHLKERMALNEDPQIFYSPYADKVLVFSTDDFILNIDYKIPTFKSS